MRNTVPSTSQLENMLNSLVNARRRSERAAKKIEKLEQEADCGSLSGARELMLYLTGSQDREKRLAEWRCESDQAAEDFGDARHRLQELLPWGGVPVYHVHRGIRWKIHRGRHALGDGRYGETVEVERA